MNYKINRHYKYSDPKTGNIFPVRIISINEPQKTITTDKLIDDINFKDLSRWPLTIEFIKVHFPNQTQNNQYYLDENTKLISENNKFFILLPNTNDKFYVENLDELEEFIQFKIL